MMSGFLFLTRFQAELMMRPLFISSISLIPRPPWSVGSVMSSQERKAMGLVGLSSYTPAHQTFVMIELICSIKVLEKRIVAM
jgi:hypothetical protein